MTPLNQASADYLRAVVGNYMLSLGEANEKMVLVNSDSMRFCRNKSFVERYPNRSFNVGIAEANMISFAAGLAHEGFLPYVFSMAAFISMRACEQCRTDVAYGGLNVRMIGIQAGCSGGITGATHWAMEDCAIMGSMPGVTILEPADKVQAEKMLKASLDHQGPIYMRLTNELVKRIYPEEYDYQIGKASIVNDGSDGAIICAGIIVQYALEAAQQIEAETGKKIMVVDMHTIKPVDKAAVRKAAKTGCVLVAQDHNVMNGLGYSVAAILAEEGIRTKFKIAGIQDKFVPMASPQYLYKTNKLDISGLKESVLTMLSGT